jgi:hypothetical protein
MLYFGGIQKKQTLFLAESKKTNSVLADSEKRKLYFWHKANNFATVIT